MGFPKISKQFKKQLKLVINQRMIRYSSFASGHFLYLSLTVLMFFIGGKFVISGSMSIGTLVAFIGYLNVLFTPVRQFISINNQIQSSLAAAELTFDFLETKPSIVDGNSILETKSVDIEFKNVSFKYQKDGEDTIKKINLKIKNGSNVAIVGTSGSGKSTLASLMLRFYDTDSGVLLINNKNICDYTLKSLRSSIRYVSRESILFSGTIRENIILDNLDISENEMIEAAKAACAHEFIEKLTDAYNYHIEENGCNLSSGQRQRILLARFFLTKPNVIILDEATSGLDLGTEKKF
ncbi:putative multidrug export ATP-binding/permease protein [Clostridium tepidiprofundi DSM 19306]|uniref:Putative multidrug export ATP-binding/permease protein n=1 Tax=Clostridium tepidiprofundi DSM 19306 TaxID=1121338 RepID=A0A151AWR6_9CLOT|nr:ABC transporter ATP-binding protein [Clostridium tepidiprofundi]KYH32061.1 putative multidrug export ATP-binding/permease protein [Clostridium tepidiprofundi DSM 19306]